MKNLAIAGALLSAQMLTGCAGDTFLSEEFSPYGQRSDTVTLSAGNAPAANAAIQTIDPWPRYVYDTRIPGDGARMAKAADKYSNGSADEKSSSGPQVVINNHGAASGLGSQ